MSGARDKYVPPAVTETAFNCPHCGALAKQFWFRSHMEPLAKDSIPIIMTPEKIKERTTTIADERERAVFVNLATQLAEGRPFDREARSSVDYYLHNVWVSKCFNCDQLAIWIHDHMIWPAQGEAPPANADLPDDIRADYNEASSILDLSPRDAAALLRLAIQNLCVHLGEKGKNINEDIAALVKKGLDLRIQKALDIVRVIGNHAVHPGQIDLRDDRATAEKLFGLVNLIAETMISQPKHVEALYAGLPEADRKAIEKRDNKKK